MNDLCGIKITNGAIALDDMADLAQSCLHTCLRTTSVPAVALHNQDARGEGWPETGVQRRHARSTCPDVSGRYPGLQVLTHRLPRWLFPVAFECVRTCLPLRGQHRLDLEKDAPISRLTSVAECNPSTQSGCEYTHKNTQPEKYERYMYHQLTQEPLYIALYLSPTPRSDPVYRPLFPRAVV